MNESREQAVDVMEGEGVNASAVALAITLFAIILFALIVFLTAFYRASERSVWESKSYEARDDKYVSLQSDQQAELAGYGITDASKGFVCIPVEVAIDIIIRESTFKNQVSALKESASGGAPTGNGNVVTGERGTDSG